MPIPANFLNVWIEPKDRRQPPEIVLSTIENTNDKSQYPYVTWVDDNDLDVFVNWSEDLKVHTHHHSNVSIHVNVHTYNAK